MPRPPPTMNFDMLMGLGVDVTIQVEWAARVTHGEFTITENLTKIFPNVEFVMIQFSIRFEIHIFLITRFSQLRHVQVRLLINRTFILVRTEQSIL